MTEQSKQKELLKLSFTAWKQYSAYKKQSVNNIIKAYEFRYHSLFQKTLKGFKFERQYYYKYIKFIQFKRAINQSKGDLIQSYHLIQTHRLRRYLKTWVKIFKRRKLFQHSLAIKTKYQQHKCKQRTFYLLKLSTLLHKLSQTHINLTVLKNKKSFINKLKQLRRQKYIQQQELINIEKFHQKSILQKCFKKWRILEFENKYQRLLQHLKQNYFKQFEYSLKKCIKQENMVIKFYEKSLMKRAFSVFSHNAVEIKIKKYCQFKLIQKCFDEWKENIKRNKDQEESIPIFIEEKIREIHEIQIKRTWLHKIVKLYEKKQMKKDKMKTIEEYYKIKTEEILYKKYFNVFVTNMRFNQAEKYYDRVFLFKIFNGLRIAAKQKSKEKILTSKALRFKNQRLMAKSLTVLMIPVEKSRTAIQWRQMYTKKKCLQKIIQVTVSDYLESKTKAEDFYRINSYFKVLLGFKLNVEFNGKVLEVLRMRVKTALKKWRKQKRVKEYFQQKQLRIKATLFRNWKFYIRY